MGINSIQKMKIILSVILTILIFILDIGCNQQKRDKEWGRVFDKYSIKGTFLLKDISTNKLKVYNKNRADSAYLPASTFKVLNSMIALQTAVIESVNDTIKWDGVDRGWKLWNKDQTMKTAMPLSCVWFYQELAKRIGKKRMQKWINLADYGNKKIEHNIETFWLKGELRISAREQIRFLEKLIANKLPFDKEIQKTVKMLMITDSTANYVIHSKTGWINQIGWNIGYVETKNNKYIFAMNIGVLHKKDEGYRKKITYEILKTEQIIE